MKHEWWVLVASLGLTACGAGEVESELGMDVEITDADETEPLGEEAQALSNGPCPDAYTRLVRHVAIGDLAYLDIYYAPSLHRYCGVNMATRKTWNSPRNRYLKVEVGSDAHPTRFDSGRYAVYAGPITAKKASSGCLVMSAGVQATPTSSVGIGSRARICN